jgi:hypothetical protein
MKVLPLPSFKVMLSLKYKRYYGQLRTPYRPSGISVSPYIHRLLSCAASARASRATSYDCPCVSPLIPRKSTCRFWQLSLGQVRRPSPSSKRVGNFIHSHEATYRFACAATRRFARPLRGALSGNLVLRITPHTSLALRGELPNSHGRT